MERKQSGPRGTDRGVVQGDMQVPFVTSQQSYYNFQNCCTANFRKNDVRKKKKLEVHNKSRMSFCTKVELFLKPQTEGRSE